jgi:hypothetical protein
LYLDEVGNTEKDDPYYFGFTPLKDVQRRPGQEIATHTFSHYYCLEEGQTPDQFRADIDAAVAVAARQGIELRASYFRVTNMLRSISKSRVVGLYARSGATTLRGYTGRLYPMSNSC